MEPGLRGRGLATRLIAAAETEAAARGCSQTVHFTYAFQARALYERNGYELVGRVADFPAGTHVLWYRKHLNPPNSPPSQQPSRPGNPGQNTAAVMTDPNPEARGRSMLVAKILSIASAPTVMTGRIWWR